MQESAVWSHARAPVSSFGNLLFRGRLESCDTNDCAFCREAKRLAEEAEEERRKVQEAFQAQIRKRKEEEQLRKERERQELERRQKEEQERAKQIMLEVSHWFAFARFEITTI